MGCGASSKKGAGEARTKALRAAIEAKDLEEVKINSEGNPDFPNGEATIPDFPKYKEKLFCTACVGDEASLDIVKYFIDAKVDVNISLAGGPCDGQTPMWKACTVDGNMNPDLVQLLIDAKADVGGECLSKAQGQYDSADDWGSSKEATKEAIQERKDCADKVIKLLQQAAATAN